MAGTTWQDVALTLVGAPIGALIAVGGVALGNRNERRRDETRLNAERGMARDAASAAARAETVQQAMKSRTALYVKLAEFCLLTETLPAMVAYGEEVQGLPGPGHEHFMRVSETIDQLRVQAIVHAPAEVEDALARMRSLADTLGDDPPQAALQDLADAARDLRNCVARCAATDRTLHPSEDLSP